MTCPECGGPVADITTMEDRLPVFMCQDCGREGMAGEFPDAGPEETPRSVRRKVSDFLARLSDRIAPK